MARSYTKKLIVIVIIIITFGLLDLLSKNNFLLFHSVAELFSISIALSVFTLTLTSHKYLKNNYYLVIGISYLFIGILDLFHTLAYKGINIFTDYNYYANQLWIAARYLESISLLIALLSIRIKKNINLSILLISYSLITILFLCSVFIWKIFPICFIDGSGLTPFKIISEYLIIAILFVSLLLLFNNRHLFDSKIYHLISLAIIFTMLSEFTFTQYVNNYGFTNALGHYFKIGSFYLIYVIIIKKGIQEPYDIIFREMKQSETALFELNGRLKELAIRDSLTGLFNHGYLYEFLNNEEKRFQRSQQTFSILMIDIDHFKQINDIHGHVSGDEILRELGGVLKSHLRDSDLIGRYGGEEFLAVLIDTPAVIAYNVAEKIRKTVEKHEFSNGLSITLSIGVAEYTGTSISDVVNQADSKMYDSKQAGRNRSSL